MELGVLGPLEAQRDGVDLVVGTGKPRAVLTLLGLHPGEVVSADALVELLWGEDPPRTAGKALQTHVSTLRRMLGDGVVVTRGGGWTLVGVTTDTSHYVAAAERGREASRAGDERAALEHFGAAVALWRGVPELPATPRAAAEVTRWVERHASLVEDRADALLATGRAAEIVGELEAAVAEAPLRERRWGQLMLALYRAGRQGEALRAYQRARTRLADELGVEPGAELRRLEAAIVAQDPSLDAPTTVLAAVARAGDLPEPPERDSEPATQTVTFLLTDIEGSTAAWEAEPAAMAGALARHDDLVAEVVGANGGRLIKTRGEGDATFSVFPRPSAAVAAAFRLQHVLDAEPWALRAPLRVRVALHTGEAELRDGDYFGRTVNRAARLRSLTRGGQVICSRVTAELVVDSLPDGAALVDLGPHQLRDLARPENVFEVVAAEAAEVEAAAAAAPVRERPPLPSVLGGAGPFVGRSRELELLRDDWSTGDGGAVLIAGEPGVGKTRLAGEWARRAYEDGSLVLYGRCDEDLGAPYQPFAEALRSVLPSISADRLRAVAGIEELARLVPELKELVPGLASPTQSDPDTERYVLFDGLVRLLTLVSTDVPVVLVLDDLHWAAKPTLLMLRHVLRFGEAARVQVIGTYRSTDLSRTHPLAATVADLQRDGSIRRLALTGLAEEDVNAYVAAVGYEDEDLGPALLTVTAGNPFFLIEVLRHVDEAGGEWDPSTLPQGVREAVDRRLSRLSDRANEALLVGAIAGSGFALELIERVLDEDLIDSVDEAARAGLVIEEHDGSRFRFNHALVRQSLLADVASVKRVRLHKRVAEALEATAPADDDAVLADLAHHYFECAFAGGAAKAVDYCRRAAEQAMARLAYEEAADLYDRAHQASEIDPDSLTDDERSELLLARCEALLAGGDVGLAVGAVSALQKETHGSPRLAAWAACFAGQLAVLTHPEQLDDIEHSVATAAEQLAGLDDAAGEAKAHTVRAACLARLGRVADCETALDRALTAARRGGEHRRVNAVLAGAPLAALWGPNPVPRAGGRCLDVIRLLRITTGSPAVEATSTRCQAVLEALRGRPPAARRMIESARRTLTELGLRHALLEVDLFAGIVELIADDPAAAEGHLRQAFDGFRTMGVDVDAAQAAAFLARACLALGNDDEAETLCAASERLGGHDLQSSIAWRSGRAQLLARRGDHAAARELAEAAVSLAERTDALVDHGDACLALASVLAASGDVAGSRVAAERAASLYERKGAAALVARARTLTSGSVPPIETEEDVGVSALENDCVRVWLAGMQAWMRSDWTAVADRCAEDIAFDHRPLQERHEGREEYLAFLQSAHAVGATRGESVPVALRGERLALFRFTLLGAKEGPGEPTATFLTIVALDSHGRVALATNFDIDDIDAAYDELDELYLAGEGAPHREILRAGFDVATAYNRQDWPELRRLLAVDVAFADHRPSPNVFNDIQGLEEFVNASQALFELTNDLRWRVIDLDAVDDGVAVTRMRATGSTADGMALELLYRLVIATADGVVTTVEFFPDDQLDAALARFEQLRPRTPAHANGAARVFDLGRRLFASRDWTAVAALFADEMVWEDRRPGFRDQVTGGAAVVERWRSVANVGVVDIEAELIAVRGDHVALIRARFVGRDTRPEQFHALLHQVVEIGADGRARRQISFDADDLEAAFAELDALYVLDEAAPHADVYQALLDMLASINRHEIPSLAPNLSFLDHRRASFASDSIVELWPVLFDLVPDFTVRVRSVHALDAHGAVFRVVGEGTSTDGALASWTIVGLMTVENGLINRLENLDEDQLGFALARFEELRPRPSSLENDAVRAARRVLDRFLTDGWFAMEGDFAEDHVHEDRRAGVQGVTRGRDVMLANFRAIGSIGVTQIDLEGVAVRGNHLALIRTDWKGREGSAGSHLEILQVVEYDVQGRQAKLVDFDAHDIDAAFAELDAQYLVGEGREHRATLAPMIDLVAAHQRQDWSAFRAQLAEDLRVVDHRRAPAAFGSIDGPDDFTATVAALFGMLERREGRMVAVHALTTGAAVVEILATATTVDGSETELNFYFVYAAGGVITRLEYFDVDDLDAALARFEELRPQANALANQATRTRQLILDRFGDRDWDAVRELLVEDHVHDERRLGVRQVSRGRDEEIANMQSVASVELSTVDGGVVAIRGDRLALTRSDWVGPEGAVGSKIELLQVVEVDTEGRRLARVDFSLDAIDAAFAELEERYLAGEAAPHGDVWRAILHAFEQVPDVRIRITHVHALDGHGAVVAREYFGTSADGKETHRAHLSVVIVANGQLARSEDFDSEQLGAALARFDELRPHQGERDNLATRLAHAMADAFNRADWDALDVIAPSGHLEDRRRLVGSAGRVLGVSSARAFRSYLDIGMSAAEVTTLATRGERVGLWAFTLRSETAEDPSLVVGTSDGTRLRRIIHFDPDDTDGAYAELEAEYVAGEAAPYAEVWRTIANGADGLNRSSFSGGTKDFVLIDHRPTPVTTEGFAPFVKARLEVVPDARYRIAVVHELNAHGALWSGGYSGTTELGFEAQWDMTAITLVRQGLVSHLELFSEEDLDAAQARFDELRPSLFSGPENEASRRLKAIADVELAHDWEALRLMIAEDSFLEDRRPLFLSRVDGRDAVVANFQAIAEAGATSIDATVLATRGDRLALYRIAFSGALGDVELLNVSETNEAGLASATVAFDVDHLDAAYAELDARYLEGDTATHADTWGPVCAAIEAQNREDWVGLRRLITDAYAVADHRPPPAVFGSGIGPDDFVAVLKARYELVAEGRTRILTVEAIEDGIACVTLCAYSTTHDGGELELPMVCVFQVRDGLVSGLDVFPDDQLAAARARFEELRPPTTTENLAARRMRAMSRALNEQDRRAISSLLRDDHVFEDRRHGMGIVVREHAANVENFASLWEAGAPLSQVDLVATRGERLALGLSRVHGRSDASFSTEVLALTEIDASGQFTWAAWFDPDDLDAAYAELEARYLAGEAAPYADTWRQIVEIYNGLDRRQLPRATRDIAVLDHRPGEAGGHASPAELRASVETRFEQVPDAKIRITQVLALAEDLALVSFTMDGSSVEGIAASWSQIDLMGLRDGLVARLEHFSDVQLDAALARFEELRPRAGLRNRASAALARVNDAFNARDRGALAALQHADIVFEDRRRGFALFLRDQEPVIDAIAMIWEVGWVHATEEVLAVRGEGLALSRLKAESGGNDPYLAEVLSVGEVDDAGLVTRFTWFDPDDLDLAFAELDARYIAGEASAHAEVWQAIVDMAAVINRHEVPRGGTADFEFLDHRQAVFAPDQFGSSLRTWWQLIPDIRVTVASVHALEAHGAVCVIDAEGTSDDGFAARWSILVLTAFRGSLASRLECWEVDQLGAALARFEELRAVEPLVEENACSRAVARFVEAWNTKGPAGSDGIIGDGIWDDRRRGLRHRLQGHDALMGAFGAAYGVGATVVESDLVATRGAEWALCRMRMHAGRAENVADFLGVVELDGEGRLADFIWFDAEDVDAAYEELDTRAGR